MRGIYPCNAYISRLIFCLLLSRCLDIFLCHSLLRPVRIHRDLTSAPIHKNSFNSQRYVVTVINEDVEKPDHEQTHFFGELHETKKN